MIFGQMGDIIKMAKDMQGKMKTMKTELSLEVHQGFANGVSCTMNGEMDIKELKIEPKMLDANNAQKLEQAVKESVEKALKSAKDSAAKKMKGLTGGLGLPPGML